MVDKCKVIWYILSGTEINLQKFWREKTLENKLDKKLSIQKMALCALFTALICVGAFIRIPFPFIPFTLQTMFVLLAGLMLGGRLGAISATLYMVLGLVGVPVFTGGGGIGYIIKPTFGYIIGFCFAAYAVGKIAHKNNKTPSLKQMVIAVIVGELIIYVFGMGYYFIVANFFINKPIAVTTLFIQFFLMTIPGDIIKSICACLIATRVNPHIRKLVPRKS